MLVEWHEGHNSRDLVPGCPFWLFEVPIIVDHLSVRARDELLGRWAFAVDPEQLKPRIQLGYELGLV